MTPYVNSRSCGAHMVSLDHVVSMLCLSCSQCTVVTALDALIRKLDKRRAKHCKAGSFQMKERINSSPSQECIPEDAPDWAVSAQTSSNTPQLQSTPISKSTQNPKRHLRYDSGSDFSDSSDSSDSASHYSSDYSTDYNWTTHIFPVGVCWCVWLWTDFI